MRLFREEKDQTDSLTHLQSRGDLGGSCGDREVLNLLQNLLLLPLLTCRLVGLEVKARMGILSPVKMKEMKLFEPSNTEHFSLSLYEIYQNVKYKLCEIMKD